MPRSPCVQTSITSVAPGGDGVAHVEIGGERRALFVPRSAPGDVVRVEVDASKRPARGRLLEVVERGMDRVEPACRSFERCGGCDWMHLSPEAQARLHVDHVRAALPAAWNVDVVSHAATPSIAYRSRARVHVRAERGRTAVGMNEAGTHRPVEVEACVVLVPAIERARRALPAMLEGSHGRGDVQIALGVEGRPVLEVRWEDGELAPACYGRFEKAVETGDLAGARVTVGGASRPAVVGDPTPWMMGADGEPLRLAPGGFAQASTEGNTALAKHVAALVAAAAPDKAVELHAGSGNLSVLLARSVGELVTVESSRDACEAARHNLKARGLETHVRVTEGDADAFAFRHGTRLVVLDPPRTGARSVAERLRDSRVAQIVYVSCDAQTLGRDLGILSATYEPRGVATFEMFPQTSHVETVVELARRRPGATRSPA